MVGYIASATVNSLKHPPSRHHLAVGLLLIYFIIVLSYWLVCRLSTHPLLRPPNQSHLLHLRVATIPISAATSNLPHNYILLIAQTNNKGLLVKVFLCWTFSATFCHLKSSEQQQSFSTKRKVNGEVHARPE